jgi:hypothetical protein
MDNHYKGLIWTNHAMERMQRRGIKQGDAWATWNNPQQSRKGKSAGIWIYYRTWGNVKIEVVAKQNERKEWVILSVWSDTVPAGHQSTKSSFWSRIFGWHGK